MFHRNSWIWKYTGRDRKQSSDCSLSFRKTLPQSTRASDREAVQRAKSSESMPACPFESYNGTERKSLMLLSFPKKWTQNCRDIQRENNSKEDMEESFLFWATSLHSVKLTSVHDVNDKLKSETGNKYFMHQKTEDTSRPLEKCLKSDTGWARLRRACGQHGRQQRHSPEAEAELHGRQEHFLRLKRDRGDIGNKGYHRSMLLLLVSTVMSTLYRPDGTNPTGSLS